MGSDAAAGDEIARLRSEIGTLRALFQLALDSDAERDLVLATAALIREKTKRLDELEAPGWIE